MKLKLKQRTVSLAIAALLVTSFNHIQAETESPSSRKMSVEEAKSKTFNLKAHEGRINFYFDRISADGNTDGLSEQLLTVHAGMKKGNYKYDFETARKVIQEVYGDRAPDASSSLMERKAELRQKYEAKSQN